ncbi:MAG TPA: methyl-accepting chemotaxis protein [Symbiobacteriaceae bacterium]|jgi:methyl-accepting chemotaxis protein|nr:methyl-accepting chemotaxis protein [Symbiobacteriaceae bacterium]
MRLQLEEMTMAAATAASKSGHRMGLTATSVGEAHDLLEQAVEGIAVTQSGVAEVAAAANRAAALSEETRGVTEQGAAVIHGAIDSVGRIQQQIAAAQVTVQALSERSAQIVKVSEVIEGIAKKTNLLSLNAAIEAARAGEHGRGFAVVAGEVRNLADSTSRQTREIRQLIDAVSADLQATHEAIERVKGQADAGAGLAGQAGTALTQIQTLVDRAAAPLGEIAGLAEEQSAALEQASASLQDVSGSIATVSDQAKEVAEMTSGLSGMTESAFSSLSRFAAGSRADQVRAVVTQIAAETEQALTEVVDNGQVRLDDLLAMTYEEYKGPLVDRLRSLWGSEVNRAPRDGFFPPKYATGYDQLVDAHLRDVLDRYLDAHTDIIHFLVLSDLNGYSAAQNKRYCQPWTGVKETDYQSRVKRLNCDDAQVKASRMGLNWQETEPLTANGVADVRNLRTVHSRAEFLRAGCNLTEPAGGDRSVLLQTFARHTGTIVNILSVPVYVKGQRYGAIIAGWLPESKKR